MIAKKFKIVKQNGILYYLLYKERKLQNALKKDGFKLVDILGEWNDYGYKKLGKGVEKTAKSTRYINKMLIELEKSELEEVKKTKETREEKLKRFLIAEGLDEEEADNIVNEKLDYKIQQINSMLMKQCEAFSSQREKLIEKMERKPAIYNVTKDYARACIEAHIRHHSGYEEELEKARELAKEGTIDKSEVKDYARSQYYRKRYYAMG